MVAAVYQIQIVPRHLLDVYKKYQGSRDEDVEAQGGTHTRARLYRAPLPAANQPVWACSCSHAEVGQYNSLGSRGRNRIQKQKVGWLDVTVAESVLVAVIDLVEKYVGIFQWRLEQN